LYNTPAMSIPTEYIDTLSISLAPPTLRATILQLKNLADVQKRLDRVPELFLDAIFIAFQSEKGRAGFAEDLRWCAGLCRATWREEALWNGMVHVRRGKRKYHAPDVRGGARGRSACALAARSWRADGARQCPRLDSVFKGVKNGPR
jgi:hypothetical protein